MPCRKVIFTNDCYYHLFNRGVEKRIIFQDPKDYNTFLEIFAYYIIPDKKTFPFSRKPKIKISNSISLLSYCLMPNHFHFLIKQKEAEGILKFMHALSTTYSLYFNKRYKRVGSLFQGRFKAKMITRDDYLLHLSKYIHLNPKDSFMGKLEDYPYSSYRFYLSGAPKDFIDTDTVLSYYSSTNTNLSYKSFVEDIELDSDLIHPFFF